MSEQSVLRGRVGQFDSIVLENKHVRVVVIPQLGARIWHLEDRVRGRQWIWHRPDVPLANAEIGAVYDDVWAGGWEELFPNDAPGHFEGRDLPDHGEWWTLNWGVNDASSEALQLTALCTVIKAKCSKEIRVARDEARVSITYRIVSMEDRPFHFLFKQHLPIGLSPACRLVLPGGKVHSVDPSFGTLLSGSGPFTWPHCDGDHNSAVNLRVVPPESSAEREFVYVTDLPEPWCGVDDIDQQSSLRMRFDGAVFPYVWLFMSYGGWRNAYTAVLEPCTNMPKDLGEAVRRGQSASLGPGEEFVATVSVALSAWKVTRTSPL